MPNSTLLGFPFVDEAQSQKVVTINYALQALEDLAAGKDFVFLDAYANTAQSIPTGADTVVHFDTEVEDAASCFATYVFTAPNSGLYQVNACVELSTLTTGSGFHIAVRKNGTVLKRGNTDNGTQTDMRVTIACVVRLAATNTVDIIARHGSVAAANLVTGPDISWVQVTQLGRT